MCKAISKGRPELPMARPSPVFMTHEPVSIHAWFPREGPEDWGAVPELVRTKGLWYKQTMPREVAGVPTVLIVEDEKNLLELYRSELTAEGYDVIVASTGKQAVELLKSKRPDVVVMDIRMPEMDGIEALGKVVARHKNIPVIINTAYPSYQEDFRVWVADEYVIKSSDLTDLKRALRRVLEKPAGNRR